MQALFARASGRRRMRSSRPIATGRGLKEPIRRVCARWGYAARAILAYAKPIWAMWLLLPPSISFS
jgi:hypothetical protein